MKKLTLALAAVMMMSMSFAQDQNNTGTGMQDNSMKMTSGPWKMRKSTGDATVDRMWFIMDRTLNAAEAETLRSMFRNMPGNTDYVVMKAIVNAIDKSATADTNYATSNTGDWGQNSMTMGQVWNRMVDGLSWTEHGALGVWEANATPSQMEAVSKLVRLGGYANTMWNNRPTSG